MNQTVDAIVRAAQQLVGTPFRLRGTDPQFGLDCLGVAIHVLSAAGETVRPPAPYGLRNSNIERFVALAKAANLVGIHPPHQAGDLLVTVPGPAQHHLMICVGENRFVHAHAGLGRVVSWNGTISSPVVAIWRHRSVVSDHHA